MNRFHQSSPKYMGSPGRNNQQYGVRQPLYLQPNSPHMSPKERFSSPRKSSGNPDFHSLNISPVNRVRHSWQNHNYSNSSLTSNWSTPPSHNSSLNTSPYRNNKHGNFSKGSDKFNSSGSGSPHISLYVSKDTFEDPWAELKQQMEDKESLETDNIIEDNEGTQN